ncbi:MAG: hypothetical protein ACLR23_20805 [Clostridia bacterium]
MEDAIRLGCDSINISIGSAAGFTNDEEEIQEVFCADLRYGRGGCRCGGE